MEEQLEPQDPQQEQNKIAKQFDAHFKKLVALMGGESAFRKPTIPNDSVGALVEELIKERREERIKDFKNKAKDLLDKKIEFDKEVRKAQEEFIKKVNQKKQEFTEEMKKLFSVVEDIAAIEKSYYNSVKTLDNNGI